MPDRARSVRRASIVALLVPLAACAHQRAALVDAPPAPPVQVAAVALPPVGAGQINVGLSSAATVWHLRAALNVAALACRGSGEAVTAARYNALIASQRKQLAAAQTALAGEFRTGGSGWQDRYDHAMTRVYNYFSDTPSRARFCATATAVLADAQGLAPGALPGFAAARLPLLDAAIAQPEAELPRPVLALAAAPAPSTPTARPRLELDLSTLPAD